MELEADDPDRDFHEQVTTVLIGIATRHGLALDDEIYGDRPPKQARSRRR